MSERVAPDTQAAKRPSVFSYRASRSSVENNLGRGQTKPPEDRRTPTGKTRLKRLIRVIVILGVVVLVGSNLLLSADAKVVMVAASNTFRDPAVYQKAASDAFLSSKFNTNKVTVDAGGIRESLMKTFPELADVSVSLPLIGRQPVVYLEPSTSRLIVQTVVGEVFVLDDTGRAVAAGPVVDSLREAGLPEVKDENQLDVSLGSAVLPSTSVAFITEVAQQLKAKGVTIASLTLTNTPSELHVRLSEVGYYIKFNTRGDARVAVGSLLALKQYLESQHKTPAEYIDARIENRAYYK